MRGRLIGVVGPSGVGKDTIIEKLGDTFPNLEICRRVITREANAGGEVFNAVNEAEFDEMAKQGAFSLWWKAHGLSYGIPILVEQQLAEGRDVIVNLSRTVLEKAYLHFQDFEVLSLTAPAEVLAARLAARGRESETDILARLRRTTCALPEGIPTLSASNDRPLQDVILEVGNHFFPSKGSL